MRLSQLKNKKLISEGWNDPQFTLFEEKTIQPWVAQVEQYIVEADLTKDQIKNLFTSIEKGADEAGDNRTGVGKAKDIAGLPVEAVKWIDNKINELGKAAQKAGPVQNADAKFEELKQKIGSNDNKVVNAIKAVSDWAKANPKKASLAVAILTAAAALAAGPLGGAVAGFLARATKDLLQGEKLSTAVGKSIKTAAYGAMAGWLFNQLGDWIEGLRIDSVPYEKEGLVALKFDVPQYKWSGTNIMGLPSSGEFGGQGTLWLNTAAMDGPYSWGEYSKEIIAQAEAGDLGAFNDLMDMNKFLTPANAIKSMNVSNELAKEIAVNNDAALKVLQSVNDGISALAQGSVQATKDGGQAVSPEDTEADGKSGEEFADKNESVILKGQKLSEGQIYLLFNKIETVNTHMLENKLMFESVFDAVTYYNRQTLNEIDGGAIDAVAGSKAAKSIGSGLKKGIGAIKKAGRNLTAKVTADKLMKAWTKAGEPTDSNEIADKVLKPAGVADDVIKGTYDAMKIEVPKATDAPDGDADATAADADTNADAPTDSTAGDSGSDTTDTGAADTNTGGDEPAATDDATATDAPTGDTATSSADTGTGTTTSAKDERYYLQKNTKDETKVDIIDKQTSKPIKNGVALAPEKAEPMSDKMNKEAGKFAPQEGDKFIMQPNAQNPKTFDVLDTQTDQPVEKGAALQPGEAEELRDKLNSQSTTSTSNTSTDTSTTDGATDANTASTSGDQGGDATTTPQAGQDAAQDATDAETPVDTSQAPDQRPDRTQGQKDYNPTQSTPVAPVNMGDLVVSIKKLKPEVQAIIKKELTA